jgi:hypothetical protein
VSWQEWAPPLDPPTPGGLDRDQAQRIADACADESPHLCAALQWEHYAATLAATASVSQVTTGSQSLTYSPAQPTGDYGLALARASWHRSFLGTLHSVPLRLAPL